MAALCLRAFPVVHSLCCGPRVHSPLWMHTALRGTWHEPYATAKLASRVKGHTSPPPGAAPASVQQPLAPQLRCKKATAAGPSATVAMRPSMNCVRQKSSAL